MRSRPYHSSGSYLERQTGVGDVTHHGYLPILEDNRDVDELVALRTHLHDLLARVILKILAFDGGYNPGVLTYKSAHRLDWVKPHANARTLGYK